MSKTIKTEKTNAMKNILIILSPIIIFMITLLYNMANVESNQEESNSQNKIYGNYLALPFDGIIKEESHLTDLSYITIYDKVFGETTVNVIKFTKNNVVINIEEGAHNSIVIKTADKENIIMDKENKKAFKNIILKKNEEEKSIITITLNKNTILTENKEPEKK